MRSDTRNFAATIIAVSRWRVARAVAMMVAFSLTEGVGLALLLPTLEIAGLDLAHQGVAGRYARIVSSGLRALGLEPSLALLLSIFVVLVGVRALFGKRQSVEIYEVDQELEHHLRTRLYRAIANASWLTICRARGSDLTHALTAEIDRIGYGAYAMLMLAGDLVIGVLYVAVAFALSAGMTMVVLGCGVILAIVLRRRAQAVHERGEEISSMTQRLYGAAIEHLQNLKATKTYGLEARNCEIFSTLSAEVARANVESAREQAGAATAFELGSVVILAIVLFGSIRMLQTPPAAILILLVLFARLMPRIMSAQHNYRAFVNSVPSFANVIGIERRCASSAEAGSRPHHRLKLEHQLATTNVSFRYAESGPNVLREVSIAIPAGRIVALVGPSGAGKSTIADILTGLIAPDSGSVLLDGRPIGQSDLRGWSDQVGYVASDTFLFHASIRENLAWASAGAREVELWKALEDAAAASMVAGLARGLDTIIGDRGVMLSHGERQRLALARAFLRDPALLILDEATNNLDSENERTVLNAIARRRGELTVVLIAHRLATVRAADLIYVVENGTIVESGDWASLIANRESRFRTLWEAQSLHVESI
ncbi:MAG: ABC transporter ATP-binding protein, partial [Candidatus Binatus sp.]|uniref:ABC transporter ATP-binding protein n=1 Tax=Candidatus Binatus sp. TaxID=2811406 RepID=UPI002715FAD9